MSSIAADFVIWGVTMCHSMMELMLREPWWVPSWWVYTQGTFI